jgi:hypothetical protein
MNEPTRLDQALTLAQLGYKVLPICFAVNGQCGCGQGHQGHDIGKAPIGRLAPHGVDDATTDEAGIITWWSLMPDAGVGIELETQKVLVIDPDSQEAQDEAHANGISKRATRHSRWDSYLHKRPDNCPAGRAIHRGRSKQIDILASGYVAAFTTHQDGHEVMLSPIVAPDDLPPADSWAINILARQTIQSAAGDVPDLGDLPAVDADTVKGLKVPPWIKSLITDGHSAESWEERSGALWKVEKELLAAGYEPPFIAAVILGNKIGAKAREKRDPRKWLAGDINRAKEKTSPAPTGPTLTVSKAVEAMGPEPSTDQIMANVSAAQIEEWRTKAELYDGAIATLQRENVPMRRRAHMVLAAEEIRVKGLQRGGRLDFIIGDWARRWHEPEAAVGSSLRQLETDRTVTDVEAPIRFVSEYDPLKLHDGTTVHRRRVHATLTVPNTDILPSYASMPVKAPDKTPGGYRPRNPQCPIHGTAQVRKRDLYVCEEPGCNRVVHEGSLDMMKDPYCGDELVISQDEFTVTPKCTDTRALDTTTPHVDVPLVIEQNGVTVASQASLLDPSLQDVVTDEDPPDRDDHQTSPTQDGKCRHCKRPLRWPSEYDEGSGYCSACIEELHSPPPIDDVGAGSYDDYVYGMVG